MQSTYLAFHDTRLAVLDEGSGPAVVLLHGALLAKETWDAQAAALARRARVVRFDFRGHGASNAPSGPYLMESLAGDVADVLDALGIERAAIVGHSLGGYVAFAFYRMFAERCTALGLVCTRAAADDDAGAAAREDLATRIEREGIGPALDAVVPQAFAPQTYVDRPELASRLAAVIERTDPAGAAAMMRGMASRVAGTHDVIVPRSFSDAMAARIPGARIDVLACGHVPLFEEPAALTASLEELLASAVPASVALTSRRPRPAPRAGGA